MMNADANSQEVNQVSPVPRSHRHRRRIGWGLLGLLLFIILLVAAGAAYQGVATARDMRNFPPPGQIVEVNGRDMHISCVGEGSPTVILEAGGAGNALTWYLIQPEIAGTTRVCAYDRAGMGWSESGPDPRDGEQIAGELHALLENADIPGPYVLAGWSYGGLFARSFARQYPAEVSGLVLLDATHPDVWTGTEAGQAQYRSDTQLYSISRLLVRLGLLRAWNPLAAPPATIPADLAGPWQTTMNTTRMWDTTAAESQAILDTMAQVRQAAPLGDLPLVVVTAGAHQEADSQWAEYQNELAQLSTNSIHLVVDGAEHQSLLWDAEATRQSIDAIRQIVAAIRENE